MSATRRLSFEDDTAVALMTADPRLIEVAVDLLHLAPIAEAMVEQLGDLDQLLQDRPPAPGLRRHGSGQDPKRMRPCRSSWTGSCTISARPLEKAAAAIAMATEWSCDFVTVHAEPQVLAAAVKGRGGAKEMKVLGVTVMTSQPGRDDLKAMGYGLGVAKLWSSGAFAR